MIEVYDLDWTKSLEKGKLICEKHPVYETEKECLNHYRRIFDELKKRIEGDKK